MDCSSFAHILQLLRKSVQSNILPILDNEKEEVRFEDEGVALKYFSLTAWYSSSKKVRQYLYYTLTPFPYLMGTFHLVLLFFYTCLRTQAFYTIHTLAFFLHNFQFFKASALEYITAAKKVSFSTCSSSSSIRPYVLAASLRSSALTYIL